MEKHISFFRHTEGKILIAGLALLSLLLLLLLLSAVFIPGSLQTLLGMTATNIIFGRMAGLSIGIADQMDTRFLISFTSLIEMIMVLLFYPLFVQSWDRLEIITYKPLHRFFERAGETAEKYQSTIKKYGIPGLIFFVLTPLAMTGPVVGSFLGYILGFSHRKTLGTILIATIIAVSLWTYLIGHFETLLITYSSLLNIGLLAAAVLMGIWYIVKEYLIKEK